MYLKDTLNQYDNIIEEVAEEVIEHHIGYEIDFTPDSPEMYEDLEIRDMDSVRTDTSAKDADEKGYYEDFS